MFKFLRALFSNSVIDLNKPVENTEHKFGEGQFWYLAHVKMPSGKIQHALFSQSQVAAALTRATKNPEDTTHA